jgi:hypothetical protein
MLYQFKVRTNENPINVMKSITAILLIAIMGIFGTTSCTSEKDTKPQPVLGTRSVTIIEKDGL